MMLLHMQFSFIHVFEKKKNLYKKTWDSFESICTLLLIKICLNEGYIEKNSLQYLAKHYLVKDEIPDYSAD